MWDNLVCIRDRTRFDRFCYVDLEFKKILTVPKQDTKPLAVYEKQFILIRQVNKNDKIFKSE